MIGFPARENQAMAGGWHVLLESDLPGVHPSPGAGKALLYYHHQIDDLARELGVMPLSSFFRPDRAGVAAFLRSQGVEPDEDALPEEEWFEAYDGLVTVRGLLERLREEATAVPQSDKVVADLDEIERALVPAEVAGVRFRLTRVLPANRKSPELLVTRRRRHLRRLDQPAGDLFAVHVQV